MQLQVELTGIGHSEAVGSLNVVHVGYQVKGGFGCIRACVVKKNGQPKGGVLLICVSDEQPACRRERESVCSEKEEKRRSEREGENNTLHQRRHIENWLRD